VAADGGSLQDIAPTMLYLLNLPQPAAMTGRRLLKLRGDRRSVA
jgi:2,3-bisphosphoglycerate-independent phosphoglycerate mutase